MSPRPAGTSFLHHRLLVLAIAFLAGGGLCLADSMPTSTAPSSAVQVELTTDRHVGFAPMNVEVSGTLRDAARLMVPLAEGEHAVLEVSTSTQQRPGVNAPVLNSDSPEVEANMLTESLDGRLVIQNPGVYTLRWLVQDAEGNLLRSNEVRVQVL